MPFVVALRVFHDVFHARAFRARLVSSSAAVGCSRLAVSCVRACDATRRSCQCCSCCYCCDVVAVAVVIVILAARAYL